MKFFLFMTVLPAVFFTGCSKIETAAIPAVEKFDISRYGGKWYEIARMPNWFERGMSEVTAVYSPQPDGTVKVVNRGTRNGKPVSASGVARFTGKNDRGELEVSFQWPFWGSYRIIRLEDDYTMAVVCGKTFDYLWILARKPELSAEKLAGIIEFLRSRGFAVEKLEFTRHEKGSTVSDTALR